MAGYISSDANVIKVHGVFTTLEMPRLVAAMHNLVQAKGYQDFSLDFSECTSAYPGCMLAISARCQSYWSDGIDIKLGLPTNRELARLFVNTNWAFLIDPHSCHESQYRGFRHVPAIRFCTGEEQHNAVSRLLHTIMGALTNFDRSELRATEWAINEITDNVINHSESSVGGFVQVTNFTGHRKCVEFVVCDAGIGIPSSLRSNSPESWSDTEALDKAIREGVTRDKRIGQGNGLYGTWRISQLSGGTFGIFSGRAQLNSSPDGVRIGPQPIPYNGTLVISRINYAQPVDLSDALRFGGKSHVPLDIIDTDYEIDENGNMRFELIRDSSGFGSREAGKAVRVKLANLARLGETQKIVIDFDGVALVSSSYADEAFGKLFVELGPLQFSQQFSFTNIDPIVKGLMDKAISQRMRAS